MTVSSNLSTFLSKRVENFSPETGIAAPEAVVYRVSVEYDDEQNIYQKLTAFAQDPKAGSITELIIGQFDTEAGGNSVEVVETLIVLSNTFTNLKALFVGDITFEECEISWINNTDMTPLLNAYPQLEHFQVRGGQDLAFSNLQHDNLKTLIVETGGLYPNTLNDIMTASLPNLEKLHLWLGSENYGWDSSVEDLEPVLSGGQFPNLKHLGLMDSELQDEIAIAVCEAPVLEQLETLDLSMGILSDKGGEALLNCAGIKQLQHLNLRRHYLSSEMMQQLQSLGISINLDEQEEGDDEDDRYIEVSE